MLIAAPLHPPASLSLCRWEESENGAQLPDNRFFRKPTQEKNAVQSFIQKHASKIIGVLSCFDRVILRGHLPIAGTGYLATWLYSKRIALNLKELPEGWWNFKHAAPWFAGKLKAHAQAHAAAARRPYEFLRSHQPMEAQARAMAQRDGIRDGLVCVYATMETCRTFRVRYGAGGPHARPDLRVCLVLYYYFMDRDFGLMHVKIQTWMPFTIQVYVNGHEWLARKLTRRGIPFRQVDNAFVWLADARRAQRCVPQFWQRDWPKLLDCMARRVNPLLSNFLAGQGYYWVIDEAEYSTDVLFTDQAALSSLRAALYEYATLGLSAPRLMTFLGRKYRETFQGEIQTHWHRREPGGAVKHWVKGNALKMYDKHGTVLRIEPVIRNPREFFVHRVRQKRDGTAETGWFPMNKGVANLYRYAQVSRKASERYLEALAVVDDPSVGQRELESRCAPVLYQGRRRRALQPLSRDDQALFQAALRGEHAVRGFRNGELAAQLFGRRPEDAVQRRRQCGRASRRIQLLRAHGLVAKFPRSRRYRVTRRGQRFMSTAIYLCRQLFPRALSAPA